MEIILEKCADRVSEMRSLCKWIYRHQGETINDYFCSFGDENHCVVTLWSGDVLNDEESCQCYEFPEIEARYIQNGFMEFVEVDNMNYWIRPRIPYDVIEITSLYGGVVKSITKEDFDDIVSRGDIVSFMNHTYRYFPPVFSQSNRFFEVCNVSIHDSMFMDGDELVIRHVFLVPNNDYLDDLKDCVAKIPESMLDALFIPCRKRDSAKDACHYEMRRADSLLKEDFYNSDFFAAANELYRREWDKKLSSGLFVKSHIDYRFKVTTVVHYK